MYSSALGMLAAAWLLLGPEAWHSPYFKPVLRIICRTEFYWTKKLLNEITFSILLAFSDLFGGRVNVFYTVCLVFKSEVKIHLYGAGKMAQPLRALAGYFCRGPMFDES